GRAVSFRPLGAERQALLLRASTDVLLEASGRTLWSLYAAAPPSIRAFVPSASRDHEVVGPPGRRREGLHRCAAGTAELRAVAVERAKSPFVDLVIDVRRLA